MCSEVKNFRILEPVYAVLDLETTGLDRKEDRIVQIGVVKVKNDTLTPWMTYVNPCKSAESQMDAFRVHRISPDALRDKPTFAEVASKLCAFLHDVEYIVAYNALFDWSMLVEEFRRLEWETEKKEGSKILEIIKWLDMYRLAIKTLPEEDDMRAGALFKKFSIHVRTKKIQTFHYLYELKCANSKEKEEKDFILTETNATNWIEGFHDAMGDVLATNSLLKELLKINGYSSIVDVAKNMPYCLLDTELLLIVDNMLQERKTSDKDLKGIAGKAGKFYGTMSSLRGKTLAESPRRKIREAYNALYLRDERRDERIGLILTAALLGDRNESQKRQSTNSSPTAADQNAKKVKSE